MKPPKRQVNIAPTSGFYIWHIHCLQRKEMKPDKARELTRLRISMERNIRRYFDPTIPIYP